MGMNDINRLSHTKWNCKYHIVFAPKYRRKVFYREKRAAIAVRWTLIKNLISGDKPPWEGQHSCFGWLSP